MHGKILQRFLSPWVTRIGNAFCWRLKQTSALQFIAASS
jgi:hypothetical protein